LLALSTAKASKEREVESGKEMLSVESQVTNSILKGKCSLTQAIGVQSLGM